MSPPTPPLHLLRRDAEVTPKERTERAQTLKAAFEADVGDRMFAVAKERSRARESLRGEELMGCHPKGGSESP